jgi:hypothetical protein
MISGIFHTGGTTDFLSKKSHSSSWTFLEIYSRKSSSGVLPGLGKRHASIAITVHTYAKWIPTARQAVVDVLNKPAEMQHAVAGLLSKRIRKRAEKSGNLGPQTVESNEINVMEKTLN